MPAPMTDADLRAALADALGLEHPDGAHVFTFHLDADAFAAAINARELVQAADWTAHVETSADIDHEDVEVYLVAVYNAAGVFEGYA